MSLTTLPSWLSRYVGLPYRHGGRSLDGLDCLGLVQLVWQEQFGVPLPPYDGPRWGLCRNREDIGAAAVAYAKSFVTIPKGEEQLGDGILIRTRGLPLHAALVVGDGLMLHIEEGNYSCIARYNSFEWASRIASFYRYARNG
jgi:cell wall-associated NlpC family hydrolase